MGVALVVGFTGAMSLDNGLAVLLGVFVGGVYGGSLSAILLNIPGTPSAAATAIDGHILARQGLADTAIKVTRLAFFKASICNTQPCGICASAKRPCKDGFDPANLSWHSGQILAADNLMEWVVA
jgi:TctA family transporter